jgi:hypothetical protein
MVAAAAGSIAHGVACMSHWAVVRAACAAATQAQHVGVLNKDHGAPSAAPPCTTAPVPSAATDADGVPPSNPVAHAAPVVKVTAVSAPNVARVAWPAMLQSPPAGPRGGGPPGVPPTSDSLCGTTAVAATPQRVAAAASAAPPPTVAAPAPRPVSLLPPPRPLGLNTHVPTLRTLPTPSAGGAAPRPGARPVAPFLVINLTSRGTRGGADEVHAACE